MFTLNEALKIAGLPLKESEESPDAIFAALENIHPDGKINSDDASAVKGSIASLLKKGWKQREIVSYIRNLQEITPDMGEDEGLKRMKEIKDKVEARLASEKK